MHNSKTFDASILDDYAAITVANCSSPHCYMNRQRRWQSASGVDDYVLNASPRINYHNPLISPETRHGRSPSCYSERPSEHSITSSISSKGTPVPKSAAELVEEIITVDLEVLRLERYLLSQYRATFEQYLTSPSNVANHPSRSTFGSNAGSIEQDGGIHIVDQVTPVDFKHQDDQKNQPPGLKQIKESTSKHTGKSPNRNSATSLNSSHPSPREISKSNLLKIVSSQRSLADHLGASINDHVADNHCKLSEDILRCISSIYCRLSSPTQQVDTSASPTLSASSSSTFSPQDRVDIWSPRCHYEDVSSPCQFGSKKTRVGPYCSMIEVPKIYIDGDRIDYASKMLIKSRSLTRRLQMVDPRKMEHEEQLAFWINIHNALVMHAYLAYGLHRNHMRSTSSILKAAYDIGGLSVNAHDIQSSILGIKLHRPFLLTLQGLFAPAIKLLTRNLKHPYALNRLEPLAHFALCMGAYSDPAVRAYTGKGIYEELQLTRSEFIQANVSIPKGTRILLPNIIYYYARDASLDLPDLIEMVSECMPESLRENIHRIFRRKLSKCVVWSQYKSTFRYLVHRDLQ